MLMQPRHHFPLPFDTGATPDSSSSTFFNTQPYSQVESAPPNFAQTSFDFNNDQFASTPSFFYQPNSQMDADAYQASSQQPLGRSTQAQDWQIFGDNSQSQTSGRKGQGTQPPRKRTRPHDRTFSNDVKKSPSTYSQHLPTPTHTPTQGFLDYYTSSRPAPNAMAAALSMNSAIDSPFGVDDMPGYAHSTGHSVSSYGHDSPATPRTVNGEERDESLNMGHNDLPPHVPKFERTISDIYNDELFNSTAYASNPNAKYMPVNSSLLSPYRSSVSERLQAANQARSVSPLSTSQRRPSPFRQGSPFAAPTDFGSAQGRIGTAADMRQQQKAEADAIAYQRHHSQPNTSEQPTISPKDAVLEYHDDPSDLDAPLYPTSSAAGSQQPYSAMDNRQFALSASNNFTFMPNGIPTTSSAEIPMYLSSSFRQNSSMSEVALPDYPAHLISMESSASASDMGTENLESSQGSQFGNDKMVKPAGVSANRGGYTCTASGCTQRFDSPGKLHKHKRESHSATPMQHSQSKSSHTSSAEEEEEVGSRLSSAALMLRNSQQGPHRCDRINPSTGRSCAAVFSRPYDLTRHEDTIHNSQKKKVHCHLCKDKSFSRNDALTRHFRVVHPDLDFPGKHRRRNVS